MNKKKKIVQINYIFTNLIAKNIIALILFLLLGTLISYFYNNNYKIISFNYSIQIETSEVKISKDNAIEEIVGPKNYYKVMIGQYLKNLPPNTSSRYYNKKDGKILVGFKSTGNEPIDVSDFVSYLNERSNRALYKKLNTIYSNTERILLLQNELDLTKVLDELELYPLMYKLQKIEEVAKNEEKIFSSKIINQNQLSELQYYIDNFNELFSDETYYTLNGWIITNNRMTNVEILFSGLFFGSLISSFFLFFKSNYFRRKVFN